MNLQIDPADPRAPEAQTLLQASQALMDSLFAAGDCHYLTAGALTGAGIRVFLARLGGDAVGCAALALHEGYGEVKSMFVTADARAAGVGAALLARIEAEARAHGLRLLRLETGDALAAARRLYARAGFAERGPFGGYPASEIGVFMEKRLA